MGRRQELRSDSDSEERFADASAERLHLSGGSGRSWRRNRRLAPWPSTRTKVGGTRASFIGIPQFQRRKRRRRRRRRWPLRRRLRWRRRRRKRKRSRKRKRKKKTIGSTS